MRCHPGHSCTNKKTKKSVTINAPDNTNTNNSSQSTPWCEIAGIKLNSDHQKVLARSGWLDDNIIAASQFLKGQASSSRFFAATGAGK